MSSQLLRALRRKDALKPGLGSEMDDDSELGIGCSEVAPGLAQRGLGKGLGGLELENDAVLNQHVEPMGADDVSLSEDFNRNLERDLETSFFSAITSARAYTDSMNPNPSALYTS